MMLKTFLSLVLAILIDWTPSDALSIHTSNVTHTGVEFYQQDLNRTFDFNILRTWVIQKVEKPSFISRTLATNQSLQSDDAFYMFKIIKRNLKLLTADPTPRNKRSLNWQRYNPIAYLGWVASRITGNVHSFDLEDLQVESQELSEYVDKIVKTVTSEGQLINSLVHRVEEGFKLTTQFDLKMEETVKNLLETQNHVEMSIDSLYQETILVFSNVINLLEFNTKKSNQDDGVNLCKSHYLSSELVHESILMRTLTSLQTDLIPLNLTLGIPSTSLSAYYQYPLVHCIEDEDEIAVTLSIPIKKDRSQWRSYKLIPIPFKILDLTCTIKLPYDHILMNENNQLYPVENSVEYCSDLEGFNCLLKIQFFQNTIPDSCLTLLSVGGSIKQLKKACSYDCISTTFKRWSFLSQNQWIYFGPKILVDLTCNRVGVWEVERIVIGGPDSSTIVHLDCECAVYSLSGLILFESSPLCQKLNKITITNVFAPNYLTYHDIQFSAATGKIPIKFLASLHSISSRMNLDLIAFNRSKILFSSLIPVKKAPKIQWTSGTNGLMYYLLIIGSIIAGVGMFWLMFRRKCCNSTRSQSVLPFTMLPTSVSALETDELIVEGFGLLLMIGVMVIGILILYRLIVRLKRKFECHYGKVIACGSVDGAHVDLAISVLAKSQILALMPLSFPSSYYQPYRDILSVSIRKTSTSHDSLSIENPPPILDLFGNRISIPANVLIPKHFLPEGDYPAFLTLKG